MIRIACVVLSGLVLAWCMPAGAASLVVYTALEDDELAVYVPAFEAAHPDIELQVVRDSTGIIAARLLAERDNPQADVVWGTAVTSLMVCDERGLFRGYNPVGIETIPERYRDARNADAHWVGIKGCMTAIVCNTIEFERRGITPPASLEALLDPALSGLITMPNPSSSGIGFLTVSGILQLKGEEAGWEYLDGLHRNIAHYTHSGSRPARSAGTGEFPLGISYCYRGLKQQAEGEPVVTLFPAEGSGWDLEANALIRKPRMKPEAKVFLDWAISEETMRLYAQFFGLVTRPVEVAPPQGYPADIVGQLGPNDFEWAAANRERILAEWSRRYEGKLE